MEHVRTLLLLCPFLFFTTMASDENVCPRPELGANIKMDGIQKYFNPGAELVLSCELGYTPTSGPRIIVCGASGRWSGTNLVCEPIRCPYPEQLSNGEFKFADTTYQSVVHYNCNKGYILDGPSSAVCQANGTWSGPDPECNPVKCGLAPIPRYGMIVYLRKVERSTAVYGDTVTYKCLPPYAVIGDETARCTESGTWTETPECQVVTCPPPDDIENGFMSDSDQREFEYMEKIRYGCNQNYVLLGNLEIVCQRDGRWSEKPSCRALRR